MKLNELKEKYKHRFSIRVIAGVLCIALAGGSFGAYQLQAGGISAVSAVAKEDEHAAGKKDGGDSDTKKASGKAADKKPEKESDKEESESLAGKLVSMFGTDSDAEQSLDGKEETVYLITDANGKVSQTIVSSWLKNGSGKSQIQDVSELSDIENVKGDETFTKNGNKITWQADGKDIYYRGTTNQKMPITEKVTYYLDGRETAPKDLAGKSGKVTIRFDYTNHAKQTAEINGKTEEIYVPFTVVSGMVLDDSFQNVRVNNGRVLSDGNRIIVAGFAMPGLKESLDVDDEDFDEDFEFPDYVEVTADVEDFSLEMTATAAVAGLMSESGISSNLDLSELDDTVDEMTDGMGKLKDGGGELADGLDTLKDSMSGFTSGADSLVSGIHAYTDGASRLADGIQSLSDGSAALESGVNTLNASAKTISDGIQKLDQTLHAKMSEKEAAAAQQAVNQTIEAQFAKGSQSYQTIYDSAVQNFEQTMTNEAAVQTVQSGIQQGLQAQGLTSEGVVAALAQHYAENGFTDASGKSFSPQECQAAVPGTETTYAAYFANAVLNGGLSSSLAGGITRGIAGQGSASVGEAVVNACETAAKQAGGAAAVSGAESAKQQIAAAIETKDSASGHSLVSGTKALSEGTQQLASSVPELKNGIGQLLNGAQELAGNNASLKDGAAKLADGAVQISDGVGKLNDGAHELNDGLEEFDKKAIQKMADAYHGDVKELTERMKAVAKAGEDYGTLCGAADDMDAVTKFIIRTDAVKVQ